MCFLVSAYTAPVQRDNDFIIHIRRGLLSKAHWIIVGTGLSLAKMLAAIWLVDCKSPVDTYICSRFTYVFSVFPGKQIPALEEEKKLWKLFPHEMRVLCKSNWDAYGRIF